MMNRAIVKWMGIAAALVVLYTSVIWLGFHRKWEPRTAAPASPPDGPTLTLDLGDGVRMEFVRIPAGKFLMGSPVGEPGHDASESPQHQVVISRDFYLGKFDVTQEQWTRLMDNQSSFKGPVTLPVEQVTWEDCQRFCKSLSDIVGRPLRLPTEAEWEYACRAGTTSAFCYGDALNSELANFDDQAAGGRKRDQTTPVGSFKPNAFGLYDMHGNVWQWCQDVYRPDYTGAPADGSACETGADPQIRVYRGGSWNNDATRCRSAARQGGDKSKLRVNIIGFRIAADLQSAQ